MVASSSEFQDFVDEVIERNDIVEVVSEYTTLKRVGNRYQALCPLHNDKKTPSFSVSPDKQLFHCFGCGAGGTVIHFIMQKENLDFMDALRTLADRARIPFPEKRSGFERTGQSENNNKRRTIYEMNKKAALFFHHNLKLSENKAALEYLNRRNVSAGTIKSFGMGFASYKRDSLINHLKSLGYKDEEICEAGLSVKRDGEGYYDKFRDRLIFPIIDVRGNVIAFGGRIITDNKNAPKYLNSPDTPAYKKSEHLFAMNIAKNFCSGGILLMEGYMDVVSLHQHGFRNAVASLGTALTERQARLIKRYTKRVVLCYDSDEAGRKAAIRAGDILYSIGVKVSVLAVNNGKDPDEFINKRGAEAFKMLIDEAKGLIEYKISEIEREYNLENPEQKLEFIERAAEIFALVDNEVERELYIKRFAVRFDITVGSVMSLAENTRRKQMKISSEREKRSERISYERRTGGRRDLEYMKVFNAEKLLLSLMCDKNAFMAIKNEISPKDFSDELHISLAEKIYNNYKENGLINISDILSKFNEKDEIGRISEILSDDKNVEDKRMAVKRPLEIIKQYKRQCEEKIAIEEGDLDKLQKITEELKRIKTGKGGSKNV